MIAKPTAATSTSMPCHLTCSTRRLGAGSRLGDVDGIVEKNGCFLMVEAKGGKPRDLKTGQHLMFKAVSRLAGSTVVVIFGNVAGDKITGVKVYKDGADADFGPCTVARITRFMKRWYEGALKR